MLYITKDIHEQSKEELNDNLRLFYAEARKQEEENYSRSTLLGFRNGIERYLNNPSHNRGIQITTDPQFQQSNQTLDAKLKNMKQHGAENTKNKPVIERKDNVWFHVTLYFCRGGRGKQRNLTKSSYKFLVDENGKPYATMAHDEASKNRPGGIKDNTSFEKLVRMYKTDHPNDGYEALCLYIEKLNPQCSAFFPVSKALLVWISRVVVRKPMSWRK